MKLRSRLGEGSGLLENQKSTPKARPTCLVVGGAKGGEIFYTLFWLLRNDELATEMRVSSEDEGLSTHGDWLFIEDA